MQKGGKDMPTAEKNKLVSLHFNSVYDEYFDEIRRFTAVRCSDPDILSDLLQEIWFEYYKTVAKKGTDYAKEPLALLYKIARRKTARYFSVKKELMRLIPISDEEGDTDLPDIYTDAEEKALSSVEAERIWEILSSYSAEIRKIVYLYFYEDMSLPEISRATGLSLSNVKNKLYRTLKELKERSENDV